MFILDTLSAMILTLILSITFITGILLGLSVEGRYSIKHKISSSLIGVSFLVFAVALFVAVGASLGAYVIVEQLWGVMVMLWGIPAWLMFVGVVLTINGEVPHSRCNRVVTL